MLDTWLTVLDQINFKEELGVVIGVTPSFMFQGY